MIAAGCPGERRPYLDPMDPQFARIPVARRREGVGELSPDLQRLAADLRARVDGEVRFDPGSRALYATDGSNYRQVPHGVVIPRSLEAVLETMEICRRHDVPVLSRGGGTSLAGQCCNVAVVIDTSKYLHGVLEIDAVARRARVLPGTVLDTLRAAAAPFDLTFGPDPSTHDHCTLGGMLGNNSCGTHSVMAGRTSDNVESLEVLTYDGLRLPVGATGEDQLAALIAGGGRRGQIYRDLRALRDRYAPAIRARFPHIPRRVSGYNLEELLPEKGFHVGRLLVGSEGTLVTILEATLRLVPWPRHRSLLVLGYPDVYSAADHVPDLLAFQPMALEGLDDRLLGFMRKKGLHERYLQYLPPGGGLLLMELGGADRTEADDKARAVMAALRGAPHPPSMRLYDDPDQAAKLWKVRESGLGATARVPGHPDTWEGWEDSAVPVQALGQYLRELRALFDRYDYHPALYGHFGQGCVHCRVEFDLVSAPGIARYRAFLEEATDLVVRHGGSFSGEHGDGQSRAEFLPKMYGPEIIEAFRTLKRIWDPAGRMNPGKVVDAAPVDSHLRLGPDFAPPAVATHFQFPEDDGDFTRATLRCVGVGECRREDGGVMCPSYMVTREEQHSTRGRAHLLFEMMRGQELRGWRDQSVRESLDLCLACKGCKSECPVNVDMATYKAEFYSHHYAGRLRPRAAYAMGLIWWWARLARAAPGLANFVAHAPGLGAAFKRLGGIDRRRDVPRFAARTFRRLMRGHSGQSNGQEVLLWPDTFTDNFHPHVGLAAVELLEAMGRRVVVPARPLCCGRPLYDFGMLGLAKRQLRQILTALRDPIRRGVPVIVLEPSCASVFRDELQGLFPRDPDARRLGQQTFTLAQWIAENGGAPARGAGRVLVQGHCHHRALFGLEDEARALSSLGLDVEVLDAGCCGMAGSFGFEAGEKYELSMRLAARKLVPALEAAPEATIVADGFSCREQIRQATGRAPLHLAEALRQGLATTEPRKRTTGPLPAARISLAAVLVAGAAAALLGHHLLFRRT
jgi:FAD/FMN-containing dehydrogenase/Fe-S oxidoreductase